MNSHDLAATSEWVRRWSRLSRRLEDLQSGRDRLLPEVLPSFNDAFRSALTLHPAEPYSGLVQQQAVFQRARR